MKSVYRLADGERHEVEIEATGPTMAHVRCGSIEGEFEVVTIGPGRFRMTSGKNVWRVCVDADGADRHVTIEGEGEARFEKEAAGRRRKRDGGKGALISPMPGTVTKVLVSVGDEVTAGQDLLIVEAMKMEIKISAPLDGTVRKLNVTEGGSCDGGVVLVEVEEV